MQMSGSPPHFASVCISELFLVSVSIQCAAAGVTRWGALATTGIALAGLLKLNLQGPGITQTVKQLWRN